MHLCHILHWDGNVSLCVSVQCFVLAAAVFVCTNWHGDGVLRQTHTTCTCIYALLLFYPLGSIQNGRVSNMRTITKYYKNVFSWNDLPTSSAKQSCSRTALNAEAAWTAAGKGRCLLRCHLKLLQFVDWDHWEINCQTVNRTEWFHCIPNRVTLSRQLCGSALLSSSSIADTVQWVWSTKCQMVPECLQFSWEVHNW